jgi:hypothetical protein
MNHSLRNSKVWGSDAFVEAQQTLRINTVHVRKWLKKIWAIFTETFNPLLVQETSCIFCVPYFPPQIPGVLPWESTHESVLRNQRLPVEVCCSLMNVTHKCINIFFSFGARAPIWALVYLHETPRFTSVF